MMKINRKIHNWKSGNIKQIEFEANTLPNTEMQSRYINISTKKFKNDIPSFDFNSPDIVFFPTFV